MPNATDTAVVPSSGIIDKVDEGLEMAAETVEAEFSKHKARMHRYPAMFLGLKNKYYHYFVPRCVTIGPYHHGAAHLERAEGMKREAAYFICQASGHSAKVIYKKILDVAGDARSCYDHDAVAGIPQADFAIMMLKDACFLLLYIIHRTCGDAPQSLSYWFKANGGSIHRDIFLLENQVPWLVLDALMSLLPVRVRGVVGQFISRIASSFDSQPSLLGDTSALVLNASYKPAHLLDLLHHYQSGSSESRTLTFPTGITSLPQSPSAIDLAEAGIKLANNGTAKFRDMGLRKGTFFCKLFLAPLVMDDLNACYLLNMMAFETSLATSHTVISYVSLVAMLMKRKEDVHELRVKHVLHGDFSDQRTLSFLQDLVDLNDICPEYALILADLEDYRLKKWMWISLHKFIYNNFKYIVTVFSITGVLVGIFQALFSISRKQH